MCVAVVSSKTSRPTRTPAMVLTRISVGLCTNCGRRARMRVGMDKRSGERNQLPRNNFTTVLGTGARTDGGRSSGSSGEEGEGKEGGRDESRTPMSETARNRKSEKRTKNSEPNSSCKTSFGRYRVPDWADRRASLEATLSESREVFRRK